jgi:hypothetical protein
MYSLHKVSIAKKWTEIARELRVSEDFSNAGHALKQNYEKYLYAFELANGSKDIPIKTSSPASPAKGKDKKHKEKKEKKDKKEKRTIENDEDEFGYADGCLYTLHQFRKMADSFKRKFFPDEKSATPEQIEKLYWKLVETAEEMVRVHYGSDVDVAEYLIA